ncbi:MAG: hypothetical protein JXB44_07800 [Calditrichaceae bacterium]|nr:hypothetical protein [Calditrichaceae bacterium]RQV95160.1 MAG: hypothetical protein EH224_08270 [Calditrichota bacterium]
MKILSSKFVFIICLLSFFAVQQAAAQELKADTTKKIEKKLKKEVKVQGETGSKKLEKAQDDKSKISRKKLQEAKKKALIHLRRQRDCRARGMASEKIKETLVVKNSANNALKKQNRKANKN